MKRSKLLILLCSIFFVTNSSAQKEPKFKFGSITAADFSTTTYEIDSSASAVVLADIGSTVFEGNNKSSFSLVFKNYRRAHILNKNGYDIANVEIPLYTNGDMEEELQNLKAVTYNLENGKVVETKLEVKTAVFKDKINKNLVIKKFTFPNIKAGSIIEFEYKVHSDYIFNLQPWDFQGQFPRLWSEYRVAMPAFYTYVTLAQGYQSFYIKDQKNTRTAFHLAETRGTGASDKASFDANVTDYRWVMKDVPPLKTESYTSTIRNHIARIEFQLQSIGEPFTYQNVMNSWPVVAKDLLEDEDFGAQLKKDNSWLKDEVAIALKGATSPMEKVKNIYAWVRDNFTCTNHSRRYLEQSLKNVLKSRKGNEAEINLLLIALLRRADIQADPVMLSTRSNGFIHAVYPLLGRFNYVICLTMIDGKQVYLDASESDMGFGKLNYECFNGNARVINKDATPITLYSESIKEIKNTTVFIINNEEGKSIGSMTKVSGYYESVGMRNKIKEKGKDEFLKDFKKGFSTNFDITTGRVDSVANIEEPIGVYVEFDVKSGDEDIIYMNPMLMDGIKENPFKSAQRFYPVEMPYAIDETYNMQMEIPKGYVLDELPKQSVVKFNEEGDAVFEYRISSYESNIMFRSRLLVKRTIFLPEEYENLREFFNLVVKKHNEQIVFKKEIKPMMKKLIGTLLVLAACFPAKAGDGEYAASKISPALLKNAHVVKRMEEIRYEVSSYNKTRLYKKYAITVLDEAGNDFANLFEHYDKLRTIKSIEGRLYDGNGKELKSLKNKDVEDRSNISGISLMEDSRIKIHGFYYKVYPYTVEYETVIEFNNTYMFYPWFPQPAEQYAVEKSSMSVVCPSWFTFQYKMFNYNGEPIVSEAKEEKTYKWQSANLPAILKEYAVPEWQEITTCVFFKPDKFEFEGYKGSMSSWNELGQFQVQLNQGRDKLPDNIKQKVHQLTDAITDANEKVRILYEYMQQNTRYISIQLGIGGLQPFEASYVAKNAYGDCKALSNYMYSLLKEAGIRSCYTQIKSGQGEYFFMPEFSTDQFDHIILCVPLPKDTIWLECTDQTLPAGYLSGFTNDRYALLIDESGGHLVHTPKYSLKENLQSRNIYAILDEEGALQIKSTTQYGGLQQDNIHGLINNLSKEKVKEVLHEQLDFATYDINSFNYKEERGILPTIKETLDIAVSNYATITGKRLFIVPNVMTRNYRKLPPDAERKYDLQLGFEYIDIDTVEIELPKGYKTESMPKDVVVESKFGKYAASVKLKDDKLFYFRRIEHYSGRYPAKDYAELVTFYDAIYKADRNKLVLVKNEEVKKGF